MKTNKHILIVIACLLCGLVKAAEAEARYLAQITFKAVDDLGKPIANAKIGMSTFHHWEPGEGFGRDINEIFTGTTDANGAVIISGKSLRGEFSFGPQPQTGYYFGGGGRYKFKEVTEGRWEPWNPVIEVIMKPVLNPIPMYARKVGDITSLEFPVVGQPVGFDLMVADWVAPYGAGKVPDLVLFLNELVPLTDVEKPFHYKLTVTFTNQGDGIQSVLTENSALRTPRHAPESGYETKLEKHISRSAEGAPINVGTREDQNYLFRVRTVLDEKGNIKSALYGKIHGDIACDVINSRKGYIMFTYYLNPTSLDRNMEFDTQHNLFAGLRRSEKINEP